MKKCLKRDEKVVAFLNLFHSSILKPSDLVNGLKKVRINSASKWYIKDTLIQQTIISEHGD
jgi:hypothetical protein